MSLRRICLAASLSAAMLDASAAPIVLRVQKDAGTQPDGWSFSPAVSGDGRHVVFGTTATNYLAAAASNPLLRYQVGTRGLQLLTPANANGAHSRPAVSTSGRYVVFETLATNIPTDGTNGENTDVLRLDVETNTFRRASRAWNDGVGTPTATNAAARSPAISGDGRYVMFTSAATNLLNGVATGGYTHLYQMDFSTGIVSMVDRTAQGAAGVGDVSPLESGALSADGSRIVFTTAAKNLATVFNGNVFDVLVGTRNAQTGGFVFQNVNRNVAGTVLGQGSSDRGSISANGRYVVFRSTANNIHTNDSPSNLYVRDLVANSLHTVALPNGYQTCDRARVADDGRVLMQCSPTPPATVIQLFVASLGQASPRLVTRTSQGAAANAASNAFFTWSADGALTAFESEATNLVANDTNLNADVFLAGEAALLDGLHADGFE